MNALTQLYRFVHVYVYILWTRATQESTKGHVPWVVFRVGGGISSLWQDFKESCLLPTAGSGIECGTLSLAVTSPPR